MSDPIADLESVTDRCSFPEGHFATAELEDESKPDGMVVLKNEAGEATAFMSRKVWDAYQRLAEAKP